MGWEMGSLLGGSPSFGIEGICSTLIRGGNIRECRPLIRVRGEFIREGKSFSASEVLESLLIGGLERG